MERSARCTRLCLLRPSKQMLDFIFDRLCTTENIPCSAFLLSLQGSCSKTASQLRGPCAVGGKFA